MDFRHYEETCADCQLVNDLKKVFDVLSGLHLGVPHWFFYDDDAFVGWMPQCRILQVLRQQA
ncbi:MAG: hypothetical protein OXL95_09545 [Nitrospira sp.]|nr:hypothetical protein [Nitrospira sp.]